jgi:MtN3 and saliva related transmembrane protein
MAQTILAAAASSWAVLMGIAPVLQIRRMLREQSSREVSAGYFTILLIGFLLWTAYAAAAGILAVLIPNAVALLVGSAVIIVTLRLRRRAPGNDHYRLLSERCSNERSPQNSRPCRSPCTAHAVTSRRPSAS